MHRVFLIPGFFGFANFGDLKYFAHVRSVLRASFAARGEEADIRYVATLPTASLPKRAAALADAIAASEPGPEDPLHLVGHSTGGLDARLFCSPGASLPSDQDVAALAARVRSVVTVASPHWGAPLASLFTSLLGQHLLRALSLLTLHGIRLGSVPLPAVLALASVLPRVRRNSGPLVSILEQIYGQLLKDFDETRRTELQRYLTNASREQALLPQLSTECLSVFNAAVADRPTTRYGCVITCGKPPSLRGSLRLGLSPSAHAMYMLYRALHELASNMSEDALPAPTPGQREALRAALGRVPSIADNDAIVPTLCQLWGPVVHAAQADHHDVIGHFAGADHDPPHVDWLATQSGFSRPHFEALWGDVGAFLLDADAA